MSKMRHKSKKSHGGGVMDKDPTPSVAAGNKDVVEEAKTKTVGIVGPPARKRLDRASGGRVGADKSPLSANSSKHPMSSAGKC